MNKFRFILSVASLIFALAFTISCSSSDDDNDNISSNSDNGTLSSSSDNGTPSGSSSSVIGNASSSSNNAGSSSSFGGSGINFIENSQIYICDDDQCSKYTGDGVIKMWFIKQACYDGDDIDYCECQGNSDCAFFVDVGTVTSGIVSLNLPTNVPEQYLVDWNALAEYFSDEDELIDGISVIPTDIKSNIANFGILFSNESELEMVWIRGELQSIGNTRRGEEIHYWYFSEPATIDGTTEFFNNFFNYNVETTFQINANVGWNRIYMAYEDKININKEFWKYTTSNLLTKDVKWEIHPKY